MVRLLDGVSPVMFYRPPVSTRLLIPLVPSALGHGGVVFLGAPEETVQERVKKEI